LSLIAGLSTALYERVGYEGAKYKGLLTAHYPWELEPRDAVGKADAPELLRRLFRNPLAHALGVDHKTQGWGAKKRVVLWTDKRRTRPSVAREGQRFDQTELESLELSRSRRASARGTLIKKPRRRTLLVQGLYWGTREIVTRLTGDAAVMADTANFPKRWRGAV
jgi:hypothetical protein